MPIDLNDISDLFDARIPGIPFRTIQRPNFRPKLREQVNLLCDLNVAIRVRQRPGLLVSLLDGSWPWHPCATRHFAAHSQEQNLCWYSFGLYLCIRRTFFPHQSQLKIPCHSHRHLSCGKISNDVSEFPTLICPLQNIRRYPHGRQSIDHAGSAIFR